jgi:very-short-patch-repair endonuclease
MRTPASCRAGAVVSRPQSDQVTRQRREGLVAEVSAVSVDARCRNHTVTPPVLTVAHCLQSVLRDEHRWKVLPVAGWSTRDLQVIQVLDMFSALFGVPPGDLAAACRGLVDARLLRRLARHADQGGESPMETVMRLAVAGLEGTGGLIPQLVVRADGSVADPVHTGGEQWGRRRRLTSAEWSARRRGPKIVARLDLGDPVLRLALQYDGAAHLGLERRDRDSKVNTQLTNLEWHVLRITQGHLADPDLLAETVDGGVEVCRRRLGGRS